MKKITAMICCMLLLLSCAVCAYAEETPWKQAYKEILIESMTEWEQMRNDVTVEKSYTLWDIDKDEIPELLIKTGTCEADYAVKIYTMQDEKAVMIDTVGAGHSSFYGDGAGEGLIVHWGHMGYAEMYRYRLENGLLTDETLFEENLNIRLEEDPDASYVPVTDFIPEARYLTLVEADNPMLLDWYEQVLAYWNGQFPSAAAESFPDNDEGFFTRVISNSSPVVAVATDRFGNSPGAVSFRDLLRKDVASSWMSGDLEIREMQTADLNGDGQLECVLSLSTADGGNPMWFFLSEQDGTVYVYIENYTYDSMTVDGNGNLLTVSSYDPSYITRSRLVFDEAECFLLDLPLHGEA